MKEKTKEISHEGHRARLTELVYKVGLENVSKIQAMEYILTLVFPRGDVNPLAHSLLDRFDNFANVINADLNELMSIKGINTRSAMKLKSIVNVVDYYSSCQLEEKVCLKNTGAFLDIIEKMLRYRDTENLYLFAIDNGFRLLQKRVFDLKNVRTVGLSPLELYNFISSTKLSYLAIAHNHPNGTAHPSKDDHEAVTYIEELIKNLDCTLLDSFIIGQDGIYSEKHEGFVRYFRNVDDIIDFINIKK